MSNIEKKTDVRSEGELSEQELDSVAGGQQVVKLEKMTITARREQPQQVVKLEKMTVNAKRDSSLAGTQIASTGSTTKIN